MALITVYSWIFFMIILNNEIINVSSFGISDLFEMGLNLLVTKNSQPAELDYPLDDDESEGMTVEELGSKIDSTEKIIMKSETKIIIKLSHLIKYHSAMRDFSKAATYINNIYELFKIYENGFETVTLRDLAELSVTAGDTGLQYKLHDLVETVAPSLIHTTSLFQLALGSYTTAKGAAERCDEGRSVQQDFMKMYEEVWLYVVKGYAMISHAYDILQKLDKKKFKNKKNLIAESYNKTMHRITESALSVMRIASRDIRSCDPDYDEEDGTYIELKWLFNGFLIPEEWLFTRSMSAYERCTFECDHFDLPYFEPYRSYQTDNSEKCHGDLHDCSTTKAQYYCPGIGSGRRYDYATHETPQDQTCDELVSVQSNFPQVSAQYTCDFCTYACDDYNHPETVRRFSLALVHANTKQKMVITGLRFAESNKVIYIEIQQEVLWNNAIVDETTVHWKETEESKDFMTVNWVQKTVNLDTLVVSSNRVIIGIQFDVLGSNLRLKIESYK